MKLIIFLTILLSFQTAHAQFGKKILGNAKEAVKQKADQKAAEKTRAAVDSGAASIEKVITGKNKKAKKKKDTDDKPQANDNNSNAETGSATIAMESTELVFQTSITGKTNKEKMEPLLREMDGVSSVSIDPGTGIVYITPSSEADIKPAVVELVKKNGFTIKEKSNKQK